jgi:tripartite-type tricarboxylate transporter receptor subunit TctC
MDYRTWKRFLCSLMVSFILIGSAASISFAAEKKYPSRPIDIYSPFSPGGPVDTVNRLVAKKLETHLGGTVVAQCKPGGGGAILASFLANSARPDGYTLGNISAFHIGVPMLLGTGSYSLKDFHIIGQLVVFPSVLVVPVDSPFKTFQDLIDYAKKNPVKYGHPGVASTIFLRLENLFKHLGMKMDHVPFKGDSETVTAVLGKHVPVGGMSAGTAKGLMQAGKVRVLFIFESPTDFGLPADTSHLSGVLRGAPFTDIEPSQLLVVHSKTPPEIIRTLEGAYAKIMKDEEYKKLVASLNLGLGYMDGKTFTAKLPANMAVLKDMLQKSGQLK